MRNFVNQNIYRKVAVFIDRIYSKVRAAFIVGGGIFLVVAIYLYTKLPEIIPIHWNAAVHIDNWGRKAVIFIIPISFLLCSLLFDKKFIQSHELSPIKLMFSELIVILTLLALAIVTCYVYSVYFSLI